MESGCLHHWATRLALEKSYCPVQFVSLSHLPVCFTLHFLGHVLQCVTDDLKTLWASVVKVPTTKGTCWHSMGLAYGLWTLRNRWPKEGYELGMKRDQEELRAPRKGEEYVFKKKKKGISGEFENKLESRVSQNHPSPAAESVTEQELSSSQRILFPDQKPTLRGVVS